ncbi:MAG: nucleotidyltransferase domain-containing protein [Novosphingobium sp.]
MSGLVEHDRLAIVQWAEKHLEVAKVYLYGSRARGDHHAGSDIDLAIVMNAPDADKAYAMWSGFKSDFDEAPALHLSAEVHLEWFEKDAGLGKVGTGVENDGVLLFERSANTKVR